MYMDLGNPFPRELNPDKICVKPRWGHTCKGGENPVFSPSLFQNALEPPASSVVSFPSPLIRKASFTHFFF